MANASNWLGVPGQVLQRHGRRLRRERIAVAERRQQRLARDSRVPQAASAMAAATRSSGDDRCRQSASAGAADAVAEDGQSLRRRDLQVDGRRRCSCAISAAISPAPVAAGSRVSACRLSPAISR